MEIDALRLLRAYEPVVRFTQGEYFYPVSVERYLETASLWRQDDGERVMLIPPGEVTGASLDQLGATTQGLGLSLSGIDAWDDKPRVLPALTNRPPKLRGGSRLAAVGMLARIVDALNRTSLIFRGSVAGGSAHLSYQLQQARLRPDEPTYYGRVVRSGPWLVCQYWFFYSFNNWRSAFGGVNEHEADWEQVTIFLDGTGVTDSDGLPPARWVVFSAHDETGDDLRRRWDDPDLGLVAGRHPIVYAGAGSHSGAYLAGDYLITIEPSTAAGLVRFLRWLGRLFTPWSTPGDSGVGIPYVDYARGDGRAVGPGQSDAWHPVVIDDSTGWVRQYRGLWGLDTRDRLGGERGPAGPRYERDGTVRASWGDPVGWSGLAKVAPNEAAEVELIRLRAAEIAVQLEGKEVELAEQGGLLRATAAGLAPAAPEVRAMAQQETKLLDEHMEVVRMRDDLTRMNRVLEAGIPQAGPHDHLSHRRLPLEPRTGLRARFLSWWAVLSTPIILYFLSRVFAPYTAGFRVTIALMGLVTLLLIEGFVRGRFFAVLGRLLLAGAALVGLYYLWLDWRYVAEYGLLAAAVLVLFINVKDVLRR